MDTAITFLAIFVSVGGSLLFAATRSARRRRAEEAWREAMTTDPGGAGAGGDANGAMPLDLGAMLGPAPAPDAADLRSALDAEGLADVDVQLELVPEGRIELPGV